jgi:hypothetical protein
MSAVETESFDRAAMMGGLAFALAGVAAGVIAPAPPAADAAASTIRTYVAGHHGALTVAGLLYVFAPLLAVPFFLSLGQRLPRGWGHAFGAFGVATSVLAVVGGLVENVLYHAGALAANDATVVALFRLGRMLFDIGPAVTSIGYLLVAALAVPSSGVVPRWLSPAAAVVAVVAAIAAALGMGTSSGVPSALGLAGFLLNAAWIVAAALVTLQSVRRPEPSMA